MLVQTKRNRDTRQQQNLSSENIPVLQSYRCLHSCVAASPMLMCSMPLVDLVHSLAPGGRRTGLWFDLSFFKSVFLSFLRVGVGLSYTCFLAHNLFWHLGWDVDSEQFILQGCSMFSCSFFQFCMCINKNRDFPVESIKTSVSQERFEFLELGSRYFLAIQDKCF